MGVILVVPEPLRRPLGWDRADEEEEAEQLGRGGETSVSSKTFVST